MTANSERLKSVGGKGEEGDQLTANSERLKSVGGEGEEGGQSTAYSDRICSQLREDPHRVLILGG